MDYEQITDGLFSMLKQMKCMDWEGYDPGAAVVCSVCIEECGGYGGAYDMGYSANGYNMNGYNSQGYNSAGYNRNDYAGNVHINVHLLSVCN